MLFGFDELDQIMGIDRWFTEKDTIGREHDRRVMVPGTGPVLKISGEDPRRRRPPTLVGGGLLFRSAKENHQTKTIQYRDGRPMTVR